MSVVIHHGGGDGTYKSFSVIQNHAIPQLKKGRQIISTIRGFDNIRVIEAIMQIEIPPESSITFIDIETVDGRKKMSRFWEWAPVGAYIIIDEAQIIFPKGAKLASYDYPEKTYEDEFGNSETLSSQESAQRDDRPFGLIHAITQHRHWNWDIALITPNIKFLIPDLIQITRVAYAHRKMGDLVPWRKHGWREIKHLPEESWKSSVNAPVQYNADKRIYQVYKSTKTGEHQDGGAESSLFKNPKIMGALSVSFIAIIVFIYSLSTLVFGEGGTLSSEKTAYSSTQILNSSSSNNGNNSNITQVSSVQPAIGSSALTDYFDSDVISIVGNLYGVILFEIGVGDSSYQLNSDYLIKSGINVVVKSQCLAFIELDSIQHKVTCPLHRRHFTPPKDDNSLAIDINPFQSLQTTAK